jgi:ABC-2 type transport system ATP-binding protein
VGAIRTTQLVKAYGELRALDGVDLDVPEGEFFGLLGPNGAGKSTLIGVLATMLPATSGRAEVAGFDVAKEPAEVRKRIGVVFQDPSLDEELTGYENMMFHARLYKMPRADRAARIEELLKIVELADRQRDRVKAYSGGMRRRLELARGLLHRPKILFLDEPTLGLDPQTRVHIWDYIRKLNAEERVTIVLTTHYMDEADQLCHRLAIIDKGRIVARGTPAELKAQIGGDVVYLNLNGQTGELVPVLERVLDVRSVKSVASGLQLEVHEGGAAIPRILEAVRAHGARVESVRLQQTTLNDVFIKHTGREIRDETMDGADRMRFYMRGHRRR